MRFIHTPSFLRCYCWHAELQGTFLKIGSFWMAKKATKRRAWTTDHVRTLKTMARQKKKASRIAKALKRSEGATRQKAFSMGLSLDSRV
jgi:hypothetical protein